MADAQTLEYVRKFNEILGADTKARVGTTERAIEKDTQIAIDIGDFAATADATLKLERAFEKAGISRSSVIVSNEGTSIHITSSDISKYEQANGAGSFFMKLEGMKTGISADIAEARGKATAAAAVIAQEDLASQPYADAAKALGGVDAKIVTFTDPDTNKRSQYLSIPTGDSLAADRAIDRLVELRAQAGLTRDDITFGLDTRGKGDILIDIDKLKRYDAAHGAGALMKKFESVKGPFAEALQQAVKSGKERAGLASLIPTDYVSRLGLSFIDGPDGKPKPFHLTIKNGDFSSIPPEAIAEAINLAKALPNELKADAARLGTSDPAKIAQFRDAANIDGDPTTLTPKELAAYLLAKSLGAPKIQFGGDRTQSFDNKLDRGRILRQDDRTLDFEAARQIYGDAMKEQIKGMKDTTSPEGNKPYIDAFMNSPNLSRVR